MLLEHLCSRSPRVLTNLNAKIDERDDDADGRDELADVPEILECHSRRLVYRFLSPGLRPSYTSDRQPGEADAARSLELDR